MDDAHDHSTKKKTVQTLIDSPAAMLCDELILEIISRLPLKHAIQCKSINKNFHDYISHETFKHKHALLSSYILFYTSAWEPMYFTKLSRYEITHLPLVVSVLASCNGLLLLSINSKEFVFNPITGQALDVDHDCLIDDSDGFMAGPPGLVVDLGDDDKGNLSHPFKLVTINKKIDHNLIIFEVIVPSGSSTRTKSRVEFVSDTFTWADNKRTGPVYVNGALYWLGEDVSQILVFEVEKEEAKIIDGPIRKELTSTVIKMWFGLALGSLSSVYTSNEGITIHAYVNGEWQVRHKIAHPIMDYDDYVVYDKPEYFDGKNIFFQRRKKGEDGAVYVHEIWGKNKWEKKGFVGGWSDSYQIFTPFLPTLAKVYDDDDDRGKSYGGIKIRSRLDYNCVPAFYECLRKLQQFLRDP